MLKVVPSMNIHPWYVHTILPGNSTEIVFYRLLVWKGREDKVWVKGIKQKDPRAVDCQLRVKDLCRKLVELLFTDDDLRTGNATEARTAGVKLLDSHKLYAIRGKITGTSSMHDIYTDLYSALSLPFPRRRGFEQHGREIKMEETKTNCDQCDVPGGTQ